MLIGKNARAAGHTNEGSGQSQNIDQQRMTKDTSASGTVKNDNKASSNGMPDTDANGTKKETNHVLSTMFITNPGKGSLMQRMASPNVQTEKKGGPTSSFGNTLLTTMANTGKNAAEMSMNSSQGSVM